MGLEIERKFLVDFNSIENINKSIYIKQGYILNSPEKVVRVRLSDEACYLTIKGENSGMSRPEFEYEIPRDEAEYLLDNMCLDIIEKTRHIVCIFGDMWEIDEFHGSNDGLIVAEVEIPSEEYDLSLPKWILEEVTDDARYYNSNLAITPYKEWK